MALDNKRTYFIDIDHEDDVGTMAGHGQPVKGGPAATTTTSSGQLRALSARHASVYNNIYIIMYLYYIRPNNIPISFAGFFFYLSLSSLSALKSR